MKKKSKEIFCKIVIFTLVLSLFSLNCFAASYVNYSGSFKTQIWTSTLRIPSTHSTYNVTVHNSLTFTPGTTGSMRIRLINDATETEVDSYTVYGTKGVTQTEFIDFFAYRGIDVYLMFDFNGSTQSTAWSINGSFGFD